MNKVFLIGKVKEKVDFKFYIKSKKISVAKTKVILANKSVVTIKGYDNMADYMHQNIKENDVIFIEGKLNENMEVEVIKIYNFNLTSPTKFNNSRDKS